MQLLSQNGGSIAMDEPGGLFRYGSEGQDQCSEGVMTDNLIA
jgi:hypothetical protein